MLCALRCSAHNGHTRMIVIAIGSNQQLPCAANALGQQRNPRVWSSGFLCSSNTPSMVTLDTQEVFSLCRVSCPGYFSAARTHCALFKHFLLFRGSTGLCPKTILLLVSWEKSMLREVKFCSGDSGGVSHVLSKAQADGRQQTGPAHFRERGNFLALLLS